MSSRARCRSSRARRHARAGHASRSWRPPTSIRRWRSRTPLRRSTCSSSEPRSRLSLPGPPQPAASSLAPAVRPRLATTAPAPPTASRPPAPGALAPVSRRTTSAAVYPRSRSTTRPRPSSPAPACQSREPRDSSGTRARWRHAWETISAMSSANSKRSASLQRRTGETEVSLSLTLDGSGSGTRATGVGFLDHMLDLLARHGRLDLDVRVSGDLETGAHHTVEDTGLALGQALDAALGDRAGICRYGHAVVPMDEARASCTLDISGRPHTVFEAELPSGLTGGFDHELTEEFFRAVANSAKLTLHLNVETGNNAHHVI